MPARELGPRCSSSPTSRGRCARTCSDGDLFGLVGRDGTPRAAILVLEVEPGVAELRAVAVAESMQDQGVGTRLMSTVLMRLADRGVRPRSSAPRARGRGSSRSTNGAASASRRGARLLHGREGLSSGSLRERDPDPRHGLDGPRPRRLSVAADASRTRSGTPRAPARSRDHELLAVRRVSRARCSPPWGSAHPVGIARVPCSSPHDAVGEGGDERDRPSTFTRSRTRRARRTRSHRTVGPPADLTSTSYCCRPCAPCCSAPSPSRSPSPRPTTAT